jgi:hypothetical protein
LGGRFADHKPRADYLSLTIFLAAILILIIAYVKKPVLDFLFHLTPDVKWVAILSSFVLFALPSFLLGTVSPWAVRIKLRSTERSGSTAGNLYAISTTGSIAGVFLAGFYLIPNFRITHILAMMGIILIAVSLFLNGMYRFILHYNSNSLKG